MESLMNFDRVTNLMTHLLHANTQCLWQATPPLINVISPLFIVLNGDVVTTTTLNKIVSHHCSEMSMTWISICHYICLHICVCRH